MLKVCCVLGKGLMADPSETVLTITAALILKDNFGRRRPFSCYRLMTIRSERRSTQTQRLWHLWSVVLLALRRLGASLPSL